MENNRKNAGRKPIPNEAVELVKQLLKEDKLSYTQISEQVTYHTKGGKEWHISTSAICHIKKSMGLPLLTPSQCGKMRNKYKKW